MRFFALGSFNEPSSPKPLKITLGSFKICQKLAETFTSQGAPPTVYQCHRLKFANGTAAVNDTGGK
jgi:hypothetical protein